MSVNYSAKLIYGVQVSEEDWDKLTGKLYDEVMDEIIWSCPDDFGDQVLGIVVNSVSDGQTINLHHHIEMPPYEKVAALNDLLARAGISRKPELFLMCQCS